VSVPYAILTTDGAQVKGIEEKPSYSYYANAGIYIFSNELLDTVPCDSRTDATDLIEQAIDKGMKVTYYPINGTWIDVGSPNDFKQAQDLMRHHNDLIK
jgi:NDP-sugar pyrophosphorylase family protein